MKAPRCSYYFDLISKRKKGSIATILRFLLFLLSLIFGLGIFLRKIFYKTPYRPKAFTISIGNIVAGGTGKTPFAIFLARSLHSSVAIVMRGYKAKVEKEKESFAFQKDASPAFVGDEACLIAKHVPNAFVICGKSKVASAKLADSMGISTLVIDDGMQHIALARDVEIVMLDSLNPFGYGHLLPRGLLREQVSALNRADLIVLTCRNGIDVAPSVENIIRTHTNAPICKIRYTQTGIFDLYGTQVILDPNTKVSVFCAIAKPDQFVATVATLGLDIVHTAFLADHAPFTQDALSKLAKKAQEAGATCLICTEKDAVKLNRNHLFTLPIYYIQVEVELMTPDVWQTFSNTYLYK